MSRMSAALRRRVRRRARGLCEYCRSCAECTGHEFTLDHIIPESRGGTDQFENLCWCCFWCNNFKQSRTEAIDRRSGQVVPLFNPRTKSWNEHFRWSHNFTRIVGRTAIGRATITALRLNRPSLVRSRRVWVRHGLHPPD